MVAKQVAALAPAEAMVRRALAGLRRTAPVELLNVAADASRFVTSEGKSNVGSTTSR